jgi:hypothetical protein
MCVDCEHLISAFPTLANVPMGCTMIAMSQPPGPYERSYSFTDFSTNNPNAQQPGQKIDQELNNVRTALNDTEDRLGELQADDGKLRETCLRMETLGPAVAPFVSASAIDAINTAGGTQLTAVNTAGSTQVGLVNAAGSTGLASLNAVINSTYATTAVAAAASAASSAGAAASSASNADGFRVEAADSATAAFNSKSLAITAATNAEAFNLLAAANASSAISANNSSQSLVNQARNAADLADYYRQQAATSAANSAASATYAGNIVENATTIVLENIQPYIDGAATDASNAYNSAVNAGVSETNAATSASNASTSEANAATSASNAGASAASAAASAGSITPFTGGPVTTPISLVNGVFHTWFDVGEVYGYNTADNSYFDLYPNYISCGDGTNYVTLSTAGVRFADGTVQATAATGGGGGSYLPLAGGTMTGAIVFDGTSGQYISKGNFDTSRGGNYGISLVCSIGYEFNWQAGWLTTTAQSSVTPRPLYLDSLAGTTLRVWNSATDTGTEVGHTGISFPDSTVQTTAYTGGGGFVPGSGNLDMGGYDVTNANFNSSAGQVSAQNVTMSSGGVLTFGDSTVQTTAAFVPGSGDLVMGFSAIYGYGNSISAGNFYIQSGYGGAITFSDNTIQTTAATSGIPDAPNDGNIYARQNGSWVQIG